MKQMKRSDIPRDEKSLDLHGKNKIKKKSCSLSCEGNSISLNEFSEAISKYLLEVS